MFMLQAVALRVMSPDNVGALVLAYGVASVGATIAGGGIATLLARTIASDRSQLRWHRAAWLVSTLVAVPVATIVACIALAFPSLREWGIAGFAVLILLMVSQNLQLVESSFRRASGRFLTGAAVQQFTLVILSGVLIVPLALSAQVSPMSVLWMMLGSQLVLLLASAIGTEHRGKADYRRFAKWLSSQRKLLGGFWAASSLAIAFRWSDRLLIAGVLSVHALADYQSIFLLTALYDLTGVGLGYINLPRYAALGSWSTRNLRFLAVVVGIATAMTMVIAIALGQRLFLIHWDSETLATLVVLMGVGALKVTYAELSSAVGALARGDSILRFSGFMGLSLLFGALASLGLGHAWGMVGVAVGAAIAWTMRVALGYRYARA
jgi:O-antigen/teichoic acid export membrane protein